jgi:hypothetical protein
MRRTKVQNRYFSMLTPARGTRELKWGSSYGSYTTHHTGSTATGGLDVGVGVGIGISLGL